MPEMRADALLQMLRGRFETGRVTAFAALQRARGGHRDGLTFQAGDRVVDLQSGKVCEVLHGERFTHLVSVAER